MDGTSRIFCKGKKLSQMSSISTFSEYTVTSEYNVAKVSKLIYILLNALKFIPIFIEMKNHILFYE